MSQKCCLITTVFNDLNRYNFPYDESYIPKNGIYILFEKRETGHKCDRVVRIGTHTGINQLRSRLTQHFLKENKDRSIFRKNIGRAILNKRKDPFLKHWEIDLTTKETKEEYFRLINLNYQMEVESEVSVYIRNNFSFVVFEVGKNEKRLELESKIVSTVSLCEKCRPSSSWLGNFSTKEKIVNSGLWQINELYKKQLNSNDIDELARLMKKV